MNLRKNNGFTGVDISIAVIIILIFIPTIFGIAYNINRTDAAAQTQSQALRIASDVLEIAKSEEYQDVTLQTGSQFLTDLNASYTSSAYTDTEEADYEYIYYQTTGEKNQLYQIQIGLKNYYPTDVTEAEKVDVIKLVKVTVFYSVGSEKKTVNISTVLQND